MSYITLPPGQVLTTVCLRRVYSEHTKMTMSESAGLRGVPINIRVWGLSSNRTTILLLKTLKNSPTLEASSEFTDFTVAHPSVPNWAPWSAG